MLKYKIEELLDKQKYFYLHPSLENYNIICQSKKIKKTLGDLFNIWNLAVLYQYHSIWNLSDTEEFEQKFLKELEIIKTNLLIKPTSNFIYKLWQVFYATGNLLILEQIFQVAGNKKSSLELKNLSLDLYEKNKKDSEQYIQINIEKDSNYFLMTDEKLNNLVIENLKVFSNFEKIININIPIIDNFETDIDDIIYKLNIKDEKNPDLDSQLENSSSSSSSKLNIKIKQASKKFDEIANEILNKIN